MKTTLSLVAVLSALALPQIATAGDEVTPTGTSTFTVEIPKTICMPNGGDACTDFTQFVDLRGVQKFRFTAQAQAFPNPEKSLIIQYSTASNVWKCLGTPCATALVKPFIPPLGQGSQVGYVFSKTVVVQNDAKKQNVHLRFSYLGAPPAPNLLNTGLAQFYQ